MYNYISVFERGMPTVSIPRKSNNVRKEKHFCRNIEKAQLIR